MSNTSRHSAPTEYDRVAYPTHHHPQTHPDRLATLATLHGLSPAPAERCRMLEIGCGDGGNLVPPGYALPDSTFLGIDLAETPIAKGRAMIQALKLSNVRLETLDLMDLPSNLGAFDYIVAHGVYSWVPAEVREKVLEVCKAHLAPNGVAFVSYNAFPGGHMRQMVRDMMRFHVNPLDPPEQQTAAARQLLAALAKPPEGQEPGAYRLALMKEYERVGPLPDGVLFHDDLSGINNPFYFHQFIASAAGRGLQFLAEAEFSEMHHQFPPHAADFFEAAARDDVLAREQYGDFLNCRKFRQTLLCHAELAVDRGLSPDRLATMYIAADIRAAEPVLDPRSGEVQAFEGPKGARVSTSHPLAKAALFCLQEAWPRSLQFQVLLEQARTHIAGATAAKGAPDDAANLGEMLIRLYASKLVELHVHAPEFALTPGDHPTASPVARVQLQEGPLVTSLRGVNVRLDDLFVVTMLPLLNGARDRRALLSEAKRAFQNTPAFPAEETEAADLLEQCLNALAKLALLVR